MRRLRYLAPVGVQFLFLPLFFIRDDRAVFFPPLNDYNSGFYTHISNNYQRKIIKSGYHLELHTSITYNVINSNCGPCSSIFCLGPHNKKSLGDYFNSDVCGGFCINYNNRGLDYCILTKHKQ